MAETAPPGNVIERLANVPARIAAACGTRTDAKLRAARAVGEWSAAAVLAHLRASDDILATRAYMILARDNPPLPTFDERAWAEVAGYARVDTRRSLEAYALRRAEFVAALRRAVPAAWARTGQHETRGSVTLRDVVTMLLEHEEEHCGQIETLLA